MQPGFHPLRQRRTAVQARRRTHGGGSTRLRREGRRRAASGSRRAGQGGEREDRRQVPAPGVLEFDRDRKSMSVLCGSAKNKLYVKGAPEKVLERCAHIRIAGSKQKLTQANKTAILDTVGDGF